MIGDAAQHIGEPGSGIDAVFRARRPAAARRKGGFTSFERGQAAREAVKTGFKLGDSGQKVKR